MTKQEEIREVIDAYTDDVCLYPDKDCEFRGGEYCVSGEAAYKCLMKRLDKLGVVIKVKRELPFVSSNYKLSQHGVYVSVSNEALSEQGYVAVEPLIKED